MLPPTNLNGSVLKVLWRSYPGYQAKAAIFCQWLLWCTAYPVSVCHPVHLSGHSHQCDHIWRLTWRCYRQHAGNPSPTLLIVVSTVSEACFRGDTLVRIQKKKKKLHAAVVYQLTEDKTRFLFTVMELHFQVVLWLLTRTQIGPVWVQVALTLTQFVWLDLSRFVYSVLS